MLVRIIGIVSIVAFVVSLLVIWSNRDAPQTVLPPKAPIAVTKNDYHKVGSVITMEVSGYTSEVGQTDSSPCISADNSDICKRKAAGELICASNQFKMGSVIHVDGLGTCTVRDRMNRRYTNTVDWYFGKDDKGSRIKIKRALKIGRKDRTVKVISVPG